MPGYKILIDSRKNAELGIMPMGMEAYSHAKSMLVSFLLYMDFDSFYRMQSRYTYDPVPRTYPVKVRNPLGDIFFDYTYQRLARSVIVTC